MSVADEGSSLVPENRLVAELIARGVGNDVRLLRGFVGPPTDDQHLSLYPRLDRIEDRVEVARSDVLHHVAAPGSALGEIILWVKKDAKITIHRAEPLETSGEASQGGPKELRAGRLRMRVRQHQVAEVCFSTCMDCLSWCSCSICHSTCRPV